MRLQMTYLLSKVFGEWLCDFKSNFGNKYSYILLGFFDTIEVITSLARPKKIGIIGSDSRSYNFLLKPKDDLRKDSRILEFFHVLNKLFRWEVKSRRRNLCKPFLLLYATGSNLYFKDIRTFAVIPLNEECGIVEWVPHTTTFRNILTKLNRSTCFNAKNLSKILKSWKELAADAVSSGESSKLTEFFKNELLNP